MVHVSGLYFLSNRQFDRPYVEYSPAREGMVEAKSAQSWYMVKGILGTWAACLMRDVSAPDLWEVHERGVRPTAVEDWPFTPEEMEAVNVWLLGLQAQIEEVVALTEA